MTTPDYAPLPARNAIRLPILDPYLTSKDNERLRLRLQRRRPTRASVPKRAAHDQWARKWIEAATPQECPPVTHDEAREWHWKERWKKQTYARDTHARPPEHKLMKCHKDLHKAESTMMIQIRTGRIGLAKYLHHRNVPEFPNPLCRKCGQGEETAIHLIRYCESLRAVRPQLQINGHLDMHKLLNTDSGFKRTSKWMIRNAGIGQFRLANSLLYEQAERANAGEGLGS